jgi:RNA polymerase sigma-70 factor (ECF subfamily)
VARWSGVVHAAVRHVAGRGEHAQFESPGVEIEDIFQEVFVRLVKDDFRLLRTFDPNRATLSTWLTIVSRSTAIDCLRRRRLNTVSLEPGQIGAGPATASGTEQSHTSGDAPEATGLPMHLLTDRQRLVLQMLFDDELTVEQVARRMGVDEQTVRSTKHKALTRLREFYGVRNRR